MSNEKNARTEAICEILKVWQAKPKRERKLGPEGRGRALEV
jgi:hypothetical protein